MTDEQRAKLENLVFSPHNPYLSLDNLLRPYLDLIAEIEDEWKASLLDAEAAMRSAERKAMFAASDERDRCAGIATGFSIQGSVRNICLDIAAAIRALD